MRSAVRSSLSGLATPEKWVVDWFSGGAPNSAGVRVDQETALHYSPFFAGVRVIAEDVGGLPLPVYERLERGKRRARDHSLYGLLHDEPNDMMTSMHLRETLQGHAMTWGDGIAYIVSHPRTGEIEELWPLRPDRMKITARRTGPAKFKRIVQYRDEVNGIHADLSPEQVFQVSGLGFDGVRGYSVVEMAANSIGLGLATEHHGAKFFGNGANPGGVLSHPSELSEGARKRIAADWENTHKGLDRAQRIAILEEGVTWSQVGIPNDNAQFLETRKLQVTEMSRWLRLPPHKIGDLERATFSNIEQQQIDYVTSALRAWLVRWEQAILTQLIPREERARFFAEHLVDGLLRGDIAARYGAYAVGRQWGWLSADDIREKENENPIPDGRGSVYLVPLNMIPAPLPGEEPERSAYAAAREMRGRGVTSRRRIADSFAPMIADADERIAKLERSEVLALARRHLERKRSVVNFEADLEDLYESSIRERMAARWMPLFAAFAAEVTVDAAADVGHEESVDLSRWVAGYVTSHVGYRVASALGQLRRLVAETPTVDAVSERLDKWVAERPAKTARWEKTQFANAVARETWREAGVRRIQWVAGGGDTCPFCTGLDGTVVGITEPFATKGDKLADGEGQLEIGRTTFHPPIHPGCDCQVISA